MRGGGELEPGWGAAVEALVEEVEGGLWAGGGNPLAGEQVNFTCMVTGSFGDEDTSDCRDKCDELVAGNCVCIQDHARGAGGPGRYKCFGAGKGGGGDSEGEGEEDPPDWEEDEEEDDDPGDPSGGGGDDPSEHPTMKFECDKGKGRGSTAGCRVENRRVSMDSMKFVWQAIPGGTTYEGKGEKYSSWEGTATETRTFKLEIIDKGRFWLMTDSVTVRARDWSLPTRSATEEYKPLPPIHEDTAVWGEYEWGGLDSLLDASQGSGPWEGSYYVSSQPAFGDEHLHVNEKFVGGPAYEIPEKKCGVPAGDSINIPDFNEKCGIWTALHNFRLQVVDHEHEHRKSLNRCIDAVNDDGRMAAVEAIVSTKSESAVEDDAEELWTDGVRAALAKAVETNQDDEYAEEASWWRVTTSTTWKLSYHGIAGHGGKDGCPQ